MTKANTTEQAGVDRRQRGFFWGPNEWVTQWVPLIGLDGIGLLATYDVWCDRREGSETEGYAFPSRDQEKAFYGLLKKDLRAITAILEAVGLLRITTRTVRQQATIRGKKTTTTTPKNFYEVTDRDRTLTFEDVVKVLKLADQNDQVFRRIDHIFKPDFSPIGRHNVWHDLLPRLRELPLWQKLAAKAAARAQSYRVKAKKKAEKQRAKKQARRGTRQTSDADSTPGSEPQVLTAPQVPTIGADSTAKQYQNIVVVGVVGGGGQEKIFAYFSQKLGRDYKPTERDLNQLTALFEAGYTVDDILAGIDEALAGRDPTRVRSFGYCVPVIRRRSPGQSRRPVGDDPRAVTAPASPVVQPDAPVLGSPVGDNAKAATPPVAALAAADGVPTLSVVSPVTAEIAAAMAGVWDFCAWAGLDLSREVRAGLTVLAQEFDETAREAGESGPEWVYQAIAHEVVGRQDIDDLVRYVRGVLRNRRREHEQRTRLAEAMQEATAVAGERARGRLPPPGASPPGGEAERLWQMILDELKLQTTQAIFKTWLTGTRALELRDGTLVIAVPNGYTKDWLENRLRRTIERTLVGIVGKPLGVNFVVTPDEE